MDGKQKTIAALAVLLGLIMLSNHFINKALRTDSQKTEGALLAPVEKKEAVVSAPAAEPPTAQTGDSAGPVVRKNRIIPGNGYEESTFYAGGQEIASQKIINGVVVEQKGRIPNGRVKVVDDYRHTQGEEYYQDGQRNGTTRSYFPNGKLRKEETYKEGKLILSKEYFSDGAPHIMIDYQDALNVPGDTEVGVGKIYYQGGKLRYEWNLTHSLHKGFKRAYNADGQLVAEAYFDSRGKKME